MKHRITDNDGNGVELDDENPDHIVWATYALHRMPKQYSTASLRDGLEAFLQRVKEIANA